MKPLIHPRAYVADDTLRSECEAFFPGQWVCVGSTRQVPNDDDFLTFSVGLRNVVVQNFAGELRAFTNVCSHRFNRIHTEDYGNRTLMCRYHGWGYDAEGVPNRIPSRPRFEGISACDHALERWRLETCGSLIFVCLRPDAPPLRERLGECFDAVAEISDAFGEVIDRNVMMVGCNWKLFVENTLEAYHVPWVHPTTIMRIGSDESEFGFQAPNHSSVFTKINQAAAQKMAKFDAIFASRPYTIEGYRHQLIFPTCTLATTKGMSFALQLFEPVTAHKTKFTSLVFSTRLTAPSPALENVLPIFHKSVVDLNRAIFEEDRIVCEHLQMGVRDAVGTGVLSDEELRVAAFHRHYNDAMVDGAPCHPKVPPTA
jgi:phenylpropionate dioxygenase-like ring-hydroxylating dioxygenase large terminal subunit